MTLYEGSADSLGQPFFPLDPELIEIMLGTVDLTPDSLVSSQFGNMKEYDNRLLGYIVLDLGRMSDPLQQDDFRTGAALVYLLMHTASANSHTTVPVVSETAGTEIIGPRANAISQHRAAELQAADEIHSNGLGLLEALYMPYFRAEPELHALIAARSLARDNPRAYVLGGACVTAYVRVTLLESPV